MAKRIRTIINIDEALCNGCGLCISPCVENALELVDGKAQVIREELCDGAGFCLGVCPTRALSLQQKEAAEFSEAAVEEHKKVDLNLIICRSPAVSARCPKKIHI